MLGHGRIGTWTNIEVEPTSLITGLIFQLKFIETKLSFFF